MVEIIDIGEKYYREKWQGQRLAKEVIEKEEEERTIYPLHATNISHCITKTCQLFECVEKDIKIPFSADSRRKMEVGKGFHKLHQQDVDWNLSGLYDDNFGWYPPFHCTKEGHQHWIETWNFIEHQMGFNIQIAEDKWITVRGTLDEFKLNSDGFFIEDIKVTYGFKWVKGARNNHKIQVHVYMWLAEQVVDIGYPFPANFPLTTHSEKWTKAFYKEEWDKNEEEYTEKYGTYEEWFDGLVTENDRCYWDLNFEKCRKAQIKYVDAFNPMRIKICKVPFRNKNFDYIEEQIEKYKQYLLTGIIPEPNYEFMAKWECDPKYCPFSKNSPLEENCKYSKRENDNK